MTMPNGFQTLAIPIKKTARYCKGFRSTSAWKIIITAYSQSHAFFLELRMSKVSKFDTGHHLLET